ncbi:DUF3784 domain-containing protein [Shivajiella indica]|uniref:DUF3784 domain-containing protein n=1 Tax=Shivajiella indica TaxID=872115 RepID=A0ABW5B8Z0_9BACT
MESIYTGLFFIAIGILVKLFPNLMAGYNQFSQKEKENAIANGLPTFGSAVFVVMGLLSISGYFLGIWLDQPGIGMVISLGVTLLGVVVLIVFGNRFTRERVR